MSRFYQNLLFASIFLLGHLLSPAMSLWVPGSTCPKGKAMVCCYGTPFVCFAWTWPCDENEVEKCCEKTDNVAIDAYENCQDPIVPEAQTEQAHDTQGRVLKPDPDFNTDFGIDDSTAPTPQASESTWTDWIAPILLAPSKAASDFFGNPANH